MLTTACGVVLLGVVTAWPAAAQRVGLRAGLSVDPDQFYFGVHAESGPVIDLVRFRPNVEAGFGGNLTVVAFNGEFVYPFELRNGTRLYAGGGPALVVISRDRLGPPPGVDTTNVEPGFNFLLGVLFLGDYFAELKLGAIDSPDVRIGFGYTFP
jgi:hypothetical protein